MARLRRWWIGVVAMGFILSPAWADVEPARPVVATVEAETLTPAGEGWTIKAVGEQMFQGPPENTLISRGRFLAASASATNAVAEGNLVLPRDGEFVPAIRFEFARGAAAVLEVEVEQMGKVLTKHTFGTPAAPKHGMTLPRGIPGTWQGGFVWEWATQPVALGAGPAKVRIRAIGNTGGQTRPRHLDVVALVDLAELERAKDASNPEKNLLDPDLRQTGEVQVQFSNPADAKTPVTVRIKPHDLAHPGAELSIGQSVSAQPAGPAAPLAPGMSSPWIELGEYLPTTRPTRWVWHVEPAVAGQQVKVAFQVTLPDGRKQTIREETVAVGPAGGIGFVFDDDTVRTRRVRLETDDLEPLARMVDALDTAERRPERILLADVLSVSPASASAQGLRDKVARSLGGNDGPDITKPTRRRLVAPDTPTGDAPDVAAVIWPSPVPQAGNITLWPTDTAEVGFLNFLADRKLKLTDLGGKATLAETKVACEQGGMPPGLGYYLHRYAAERLLERALDAKGERAAAWAGAVLHATKAPRTGWSPELPVTAWMNTTWWQRRALERQALTLGYGRDISCQQPDAGPQIAGWELAKLRPLPTEGRWPLAWEIPMHRPGANPAALRRSYFAALAHGAKMLRLRGAVPPAWSADGLGVAADDVEMWKAVHELAGETREIEALASAGRTRPADVGILWTFAQEYWDRDPSVEIERQCLYIACRRAGYAVDVVTEEDLLAGRTTHLSSLLIVGEHLERRVALAVKELVRNGGWVGGYAGGGLKDEFDQPMDVLHEVYGIMEPTTQRGLAPQFAKIDLPTLKPLDRVTWVGNGGEKRYFPALVSKTNFKLRTRAIFWAHYEDKSPAVAHAQFGTGWGTFYGTHIASAYVRPGLPPRPWERGGSPSSLNHHLPMGLDGELVDAVTAACGEARYHVVTDHPEMETVVIDGPGGALLFCLNWSPQPVKALLTVQDAAPNFSKARSVRSGPLRLTKIQGGGPNPSATYSFKLEVRDADVVILD
jgi:hypothetical protein